MLYLALDTSLLGDKYCLIRVSLLDQLPAHRVELAQTCQNQRLAFA
jgi:hypothetical protein